MKAAITGALIVGLIISLAILLGLSLSVRADSGGLPQEFNAYRASIGAPPLKELAALDASAQSGSDTSCALGGYILPHPPVSGSWTVWQVYGYTTAEAVMAAEKTDPYILGKIGDVNANAVGVGVTTPCGNLGILWTIELGRATVISPTVTPTPRSTPNPTVTATLIPPATATPAVTPISTRIPTVTPFSRPVFHLWDDVAWGDLNCDGAVDWLDASLLWDHLTLNPEIPQRPPCPEVGSYQP